MARTQLFENGKKVFKLTATQLTAAGNSDALNCEGAKDHTVSVTVASINTNAVVELQGTVDGTNYGQLSLDSTAGTSASKTTNRVTITANGTYILTVKNTPLSKIRLTLVSEAGGTAVTLNPILRSST